MGDVGDSGRDHEPTGGGRPAEAEGDAPRRSGDAAQGSREPASGRRPAGRAPTAADRGRFDAPGDGAARAHATGDSAMNGVSIECVSSWRELDDAVAEASGPARAHSPLVFRGLARSAYSNVSSLARLEGDFASLERHLIRNFRKYAHREAPGPTIWDWLSLAQHHGLPTRLLDWTYSPLVALHFATAAYAEDEAILWAVDVGQVHECLPGSLQRALSGEGAVVFTTELLAEYAGTLEALEAAAGDRPFLLFFEPPSLDERIVNQAAVLSAMSDPGHNVDEWLADHAGSCSAWRIPPEVKVEIREHLDQANITERVLLPGLDGLAAWLRRYYSPRGRHIPEGGAAMTVSGG